jgi:hypothetical protein
MVEGLERKNREDTIKGFLLQYPIEQYPEWYKTNYPDVYLGYEHAKGLLRKKEPKGVKEKAKISLKLLAILIVIIVVFSVIVFFVLMNLLNQGIGLFQ